MLFLEEWVAVAVGKMHINKIRNIDLAKHMGVTVQYVSEILNSKKSPKGIGDRVLKAIDEIIESTN